MYNRLFKWAVLVSLLLRPFFVDFVFVYSAEENFFQPLAYVGPSVTACILAAMSMTSAFGSQSLSPLCRFRLSLKGF